ncbi:Acyltransferase-like protein, chloroplastic [Zostera marina]|uniref:Acyltransferase-like protein, chloroplastic n=1 Tax=Zostera marina TaxID=29655 RepID=A0A0K9P7Z5_ZOSMR|nr:Acyltransferase-like protein, chloroplastic [Zostera marina]
MISPTAISAFLHSSILPPFPNNNLNSLHLPTSASLRLSPSTSENGKHPFSVEKLRKWAAVRDEASSSIGVTDFIERSKEMAKVRSGVDSTGPPRWFTPLDCDIDGGGRIDDAPILLYLPGIDGTGFGLIRHHQKLKRMFDIWCLHIPVMDRTPFEGIVAYVEKTLRSEIINSKNKPIYLVGESLGSCIALTVAARNPDVDLMIVSANSATSFHKSQLQTLFSLAEAIPDQFYDMIPNAFKSTENSIKTIRAYVENDLRRSFGSLPENSITMLSYLSFLADILPKESIIWKLKMLRSASSYANSRLQTIRAPMLILASGNDQLFPSEEEAKRINNMKIDSRMRLSKDSDHTIFLESNFDLVTVIKATSFYRRSGRMNYAKDYIIPTPNEIQKIEEQFKLFTTLVDSITLSTLESGEIVRGFEGIPTEGPVLFVGYHMLMGAELSPMVLEFFNKNINLRGLAHPFLFDKTAERLFHDSSLFDCIRLLGAVPATPLNFYQLMSEKQFVLLYPGGIREALHKKGEEYKLFWPEKPEFIRMASRFGATIVPFGAVGEDDMFELALDFDDLANVPFHDRFLETVNHNSVRLRDDTSGELKNQFIHLPIALPKIPGRLYLLFGEPIKTQGRENELNCKEKEKELYLSIKSEVEGSIDYLKKKREKDPYRNILPRLVYKATHGFDTEVPTFDP